MLGMIRLVEEENENKEIYVGKNRCWNCCCDFVWYL